MNIDEILDMLDEMIDQSLNLPFSGGRCIVDVEKVRDLIDDIRINLPNEVKQAKAIVSDRAEILEAAKKEADAIVRKAEDRAKVLISQQEITKQSQAKASELISQTQLQSREMRVAAQSFSDDILRVTEESLQNALGEVKTTRQALKGRAKK